MWLCAVFAPDLLPPPDSGRPAMDYTPPGNPPLLDRVDIEDVMDFFVSYIENDVLGRVANAHLVNADKQEDGIFSKECIKLAAVYSTAVDYPKAGVKADVPFSMMPGKVPLSYPDFMVRVFAVNLKGLTALHGAMIRAVC